MYRRIVVLMLLAGCLGLTACASHKPKPSAEQQQSSSENGAGANSQGAAGANANGGGPFGNQSSVAGPQEGMLAKRTIYFDFDSAVITGDGTDIVSAHAKYLSDHTDARVRLEGNTDER